MVMSMNNEQARVVLEILIIIRQKNYEYSGSNWKAGEKAGQAYSGNTAVLESILAQEIKLATKWIG